MEVYRVDSKETGEMIFIAAWEDAREDWKQQLILLKKGIHPIVKMQKHFNKFGEEDMEFKSIKKVSSEKELTKVINDAKEKEPEVEIATIKQPAVEKAVIKEPKKVAKPKGKK